MSDQLERDLKKIKKYRKGTADELVTTEVLDSRHLKNKKRIEELKPLLEDYLVNTLNFQFGIEAYLKEIRKEGTRVIVAKYKGKPIGFNVYEIHEKYKRPQPIGSYVIKEFRGKGVSSKLSRKRIYDMKMRKLKGFVPGTALTQEGKNIMVKRRSQWDEISKIPQSVFDRAKKRRRK